MMCLQGKMVRLNGTRSAHHEMIAVPLKAPMRATRHTSK